MRYLLPAMAAAAALALGVAPGAAAKRTPHHRAPVRVKSHVSLHLSRHLLTGGRAVAIRGRVNPSGRRRVKVVARGGGDVDVLSVLSKPNGSFAARWRPPGIGAYRVRAYATHHRRIRGAASRPRSLSAYRRAIASYYGPGLYGGALACGGTLQPGTLGVAHKTLPCGARVTLRYRGRTLTVPVVDRGPYAAGREIDLTEATKARLRFPDVGVLMFSRGG
jgi:hypothetical protein